MSVRTNTVVVIPGSIDSGDPHTADTVELTPQAAVYAALLRRRALEAQALRDTISRQSPQSRPAGEIPQASQTGASHARASAFQHAFTRRQDGEAQPSPAAPARVSTQQRGANETSNAPRLRFGRPDTGATPARIALSPDADGTARQPMPATSRQAALPAQQRKLTDEEVRFAKVADYLLERVTDFCSARTVVANGNWDLQIQIDPTIMPNCLLRLSLSDFRLALRFETQDATSKALISKHSGTLEARLAELLKGRGMARPITIDSA
ncbi:MAG: type III secretion system protein SctP [Trinickia sp.]|jgi:type III secretion control protein HpaP